MRIVVHCEDISPLSSGGVAGFATGISRGFARAIGAGNVTMLCSDTDFELWRKEVPEVKVSPRRSFSQGWLGKSFKSILRRFPISHEVRRMVREKQNRSSTDDVHYFPFHRGRVFGKNAFMTLHDMRVFDGAFADSPSARNIERNLKSCKGVFVSWRHPYQLVREQFPRGIDRVFEVPFPAMLPRGSEEYAGRGNFLLYPAATVPHKNHEVLLDYAVLPASMPVVCVGPENEPGFSEFRKRASRLDRIEFRGRVSPAELNLLYSECEAVVVPSRYEAASGPIIEAFVRGIPVIAADTPSLRAQMSQCGGDAPYFEPSSADSLAHAVGVLEQDRDFYEMSARIGGSWYDGLSWDQTAQTYIEIMSRELS